MFFFIPSSGPFFFFEKDLPGEFFPGFELLRMWISAWLLVLGYGCVVWYLGLWVCVCVLEWGFGSLVFFVSLGLGFSFFLLGPRCWVLGVGKRLGWGLGAKRTDSRLGVGDLRSGVCLGLGSCLDLCLFPCMVLFFASCLVLCLVCT